MDPITVRKARMEDMDVLLRFEQGVVEAERPFDSTLRKGRISYYDLRGMIPSSHIEILVAECAGEIIASGYARVEESKPYHAHTHHAYLGFMYVDPKYRGQGVNKRILDELIQWARSKDITELRLDVYCENDPAIRAYEKAGFQSYMVQMRMGLADEADPR